MVCITMILHASVNRKIQIIMHNHSYQHVAVIIVRKDDCYIQGSKHAWR